MFRQEERRGAVLRTEKLRAPEIRIEAWVVLGYALAIRLFLPWRGNREEYEINALACNVLDEVATPVFLAHAALGGGKQRTRVAPVAAFDKLRCRKGGCFAIIVAARIDSTHL